MAEKIVFKSVTEMPPMAVSLSSMDWNKTGSWRYMRPVYQYKTAPCIPACPAGEKIPRYLRELVGDDTNKAWTTIIKDNPFPSVCGRICHYPCEAACNRRLFDEPIAIRALERYVGDYGRARGKFEPVILEKGKRVAVVGAGPAGLTCSFHLRLAGYEVDVFEAMGEPGGTVRYRVPSFKLPVNVLDDEIKLILKAGVKIHTSVRVGKEKSFEELLSYDAVFVSTGAWEEKPLGIEGEDLKGTYTASKLLMMANSGGKTNLGRKVAVIGGDNAAIDAARTLVRMGKKVMLICEKSKNDITASPLEVEDAIAEGVELRPLTELRRFVGEDGKVRRIECMDVTYGKPDSSGRRKRVPVEGSRFMVEVEGVIASVDSVASFDFLPDSLKGEDGTPVCDQRGKTNHERVFVGGDAMATNPRTVADVIGDGKRIAAVIGASLQGKAPGGSKSKREVVHFDTLNLLYFREAERPRRETIPLDLAVRSFDECELPMEPETSIREANRCMSCGVCTECDNCLIFCPDVAISKLKKGYKINYDFCKGCGICVHECPRNCMSLTEEMKWKK